MHIPRRIALLGAVAGAVFGGTALGNPQGPAVAHGSAAFSRPDARTLLIRNSAGAIIGWRGFSIGAGETTRFVQPSAASAVLNRVTGADPSALLGRLLSNGRVFLINPNGVLVGPGARIDTAGFLASTLDIADEDFLAGRLRFAGDERAGAIRNQGLIKTTAGGNVVLIAPSVENSGVIEAPGGQITLAAGHRIELTSWDQPELRFEISAPDGETVNLGRLLADAGAARIFAATLHHSGEVRADTVSLDESGVVVLAASERLELAPASTTSASGPIGGSVTLDAGHGEARIGGAVEATGGAGPGGRIEAGGARVALTRGARLDASGVSGGGTVHVGGALRGAPMAGAGSAERVDVPAGTSLHADALDAGPGGEVVVWSQRATRFRGRASARGGPQGGAGGLVETSSRGFLEATGTVDARAPAGRGGRWLLDPENVELRRVAPAGADDSSSGAFDHASPDVFTPAATVAVADIDEIERALGLGISVEVSTGATGTAAGNLTVVDAIAPIMNGGAASLTLSAANDIAINNTISASGAGALGLKLIADSDGAGGGQVVIAADIDTNGGLIDAASAGSGTIAFSGSRAVNAPLAAKAITVAGTTTLNGTVTTQDLTLSAVTLTGSGDVTVTGTLSWSNGSTISGSGALSTTATASTSLTGSGSPLLRRNWTNSGAATLATDQWFDRLDIGPGVTLTNAPGATFTLASVNDSGIAGGGTFLNQGTVARSGGGPNNHILSAFDNLGSVTVATGLLNIASATANDGTVTIAAGATFKASAASFVNNGSIGGTGTLDVSATTFSNQGILAPGASPGTLTVTGDLNLTPSSVLDIELQDPASGPSDRIDVTGNVVLDGTLNVRSFGGYAGTLGDRFTVITCAGGPSCLTDNGLVVKRMAEFVVTPTFNPADLALDVTGFVYRWTGAVDDYWRVAGNWNRAALPGLGDAVVIDVPASLVTVTLTGTGSARRVQSEERLVIDNGTLTLTGPDATLLNGGLTLRNGALAGAGPVTVDGALYWESGTVSTTGGLTTTGVAALETAGTKTLEATPWDSRGATSWSGGDIVLNGAAATLVNSGSFDVQTGGAEQIRGTGGSLSNPGTLTKSGSASTTTVGVPVVSAGLIEVARNELALTAGGTSSGRIAVASGATLAWDDAALTFSSPADLAGNGTLKVPRGDVQLNAAIDFPGRLEVTGTAANLSVPAGTSVALGELKVDRAELRGALTVTRGLVTGSGGTLRGHGSGTLTLPAGASGWLSAAFDDLQVSSSGNMSGGGPLTGGTLFENLGTFTLWDDVDIDSTSTFRNAGDLVEEDDDLNVSGTFDNTASGTLTWNDDFDELRVRTGGRFVNAGVVTINDADQFSIRGTFTNQAGATLTVHYADGDFDVWSGGLLSNHGLLELVSDSLAVHGTGRLENAATGQLRIHAGASIYGTGRLDNAGEVRAESGTARLAAGGTDSGTLGAATGASLEVRATRTLADGARVAGAGTVRAISGAGRLEVAGSAAGASIEVGARLVLEGATLAGGGRLANRGTLQASASNAFTGTLVNEAGGQLEVTGGGAGADALLAAGALANDGNLLLTSAGAEVTVRVTGGSLVNRATLSAGGAGAVHHIDALLDNRAGALLEVTSGMLRIERAGASHRNAGTIRLGGGDLVVTGHSAFVQSGGALEIEAGRRADFGTAGLELAGGTVRGGGRLSGTVRNTGGVLAPGASPGTLLVDGDYVQGPSGTLRVEIGGRLRGSEYDWLQVGGTASLDGTLEVALYGGFVPQAGDRFDIVTHAAASGDFARLLGPPGFAFTERVFPGYCRLELPAALAPSLPALPDPLPSVLTLVDSALAPAAFATPSDLDLPVLPVGSSGQGDGQPVRYRGRCGQ